MTIEDKLKRLRNINCAEDDIFFQALEEILISIKPLYEKEYKYEENSIIERLAVPDRVISFKVSWLDDSNKIRVNRGYRVQFDNTLGPYKGGLRFHPTVNVSILKFLGFEQIFKNALTGLPIGGGKGGSDFDPKGKSDHEILKFCISFMTELHKYIGPRKDIPAGDIGVGSREIGYLYGAYKKITSSYEGVITGKPYFFGGSLMRPEATGYGLVYFTAEMLVRECKSELSGKICTVSGSGNVALHTIEKLYELGAIPVTVSDSTGTIYDSRGVDLDLLKKLKFERRVSLVEYVDEHEDAKYIPINEYPENGHAVWNIACEAAFPCATENELTLTDAISLVKNGCNSVSEGANMPSTTKAINYFIENNICFAPAKAANAGGVAVSEFEMSQNASMQKWTFEEVDEKLKSTMKDICKLVSETAEEYGVKGNYVDGANIAAFKKLADAMIAEGI